jgi:hypothetical protein
MAEDKKKWRVTIYGVTEHMPRSFSFTHGKSQEDAMRHVATKICKTVQNTPGYNKSWEYKDTGFKVLMSPDNAGLLIRHLINNPGRWKAEEVA